MKAETRGPKAVTPNLSRRSFLLATGGGVASLGGLWLLEPAALNVDTLLWGFQDHLDRPSLIDGPTKSLFQLHRDLLSSFRLYIAERTQGQRRVRQRRGSHSEQLIYSVLEIVNGGEREPLRAVMLSSVAGDKNSIERRYQVFA